MKIGFFDSGKGGLLVAKAVQVAMPLYDYLYFGDTANLPYGDKSEADILKLTQEGIRVLFDEGCSIVVVACNTASVKTLRQLQNQWLPSAFPGRKLLGVVVPTVEHLATLPIKKVLLLATKRTVDSGKYEIELHKLETYIELFTQAAPELVPLIESDDIVTAVQTAKGYISRQVDLNNGLDTVILGCTHYSLIVGDLRSLFPDITFLAQTEIIPNKLQEYLERHFEIKNELSTTGTFTIFFTGDRFST